MIMEDPLYASSTSRLGYKLCFGFRDRFRLLSGCASYLK